MAAVPIELFWGVLLGGGCGAETVMLWLPNDSVIVGCGAER